MNVTTEHEVSDPPMDPRRTSARQRDVSSGGILTRGVALGAAGAMLAVLAIVPAADEAARGVALNASIDTGAVVDEPAVRLDSAMSTDPSSPAPSPNPTTPPEPNPTPTTTPAPPVDLVTGFDATPPSSTWTRPPLLERSTDPVYGTQLRRMTSADGTRFDRNTYSRRQAENADGRRFMTYHGDAAYRVYDRATGDLVRDLDVHPDGEPQWHPTNPDVVRHIAGSNPSVGALTYLETNAVTGAQRTIADLTGRLRNVFPTATYLGDRAEGSPSTDGNRHAWIVFDSSQNALGLVSYDLAADRILGTSPLDTSAGRLDWVSASPTGDYVVAGYVDATVVLDADLTRPREINEKADHSDIALTADGRDTYVYIDFSAGPDGGWLMSVELDTLERTRLFDLYDDANTSLHVSGKGYGKARLGRGVHVRLQGARCLVVRQGDGRRTGDRSRRQPRSHLQLR